MGYNWHGNNMKTKSLVLLAVGLLVLSGCGKKIEYRVDGPTPQEKYSVVMKSGVNSKSWNPIFNTPVKKVVPPSGSRVGFVQSFTLVSSDMNCGDTYYKFIFDNEPMSFCATYDEPTVPNYSILLRDLVRYGGISEETSYSDAYQLIIADSTLFSQVSDPTHVLENPWSNTYNWDGERWYLYHIGVAPDKDTHTLMWYFMSVLRYWYGIHVFAINGIPDNLAILDNNDLYNQEVDFNAVNKMLQEKYGLKMVPADKQMKVVTYRVKE